MRKTAATSRAKVKDDPLCLHCLILKTIEDFFPGEKVDVNVILRALCAVSGEMLASTTDRALSDRAMKAFFERTTARRDKSLAPFETPDRRGMH